MPRESFAIGSVRVRAGSVRALELPITRLVTGADVTLPVRVVHGREDGPRIWIDAASSVSSRRTCSTTRTAV